MDDPLRQLAEHVPQAARLPLFVTLLALVGWVVLYLLAMVATRPAPVRPGPASQDLPGEEPPAVVSVLANGWSITEDAAESTLLDLAARGYFELRQPDADPRHTTIHVTAEDPQAAAAAAARQARVLRGSGGATPPLTDYERQLLNHVKEIAVGGIVPLTALTFRDPDRAASWAASFAGSVIGDARRRGLITRRVPPWVVTLLGVAALAPSLAVSWFAWTAAGGKDGGALLAGLIPLGVLSAVAGRKQGHRGTPAGRELAARWFGLREYLQVDESFGALPPAAVAVWDRYIAYGDALGVTHVCSAVIDLGMGNRHRVWSSFGGGWHQVRVRYPAKAARYGITTARLVVGGLVQLAIGYGLLRLNGVDRLAQDVGDPVAQGVLLLAIAVAARGAYRLVRAVTDSLGTRTFTAEVLWVAPWKIRSQDENTVTTLYYLALDDGSADRTTAWALPAELRSRHAFRPGRPVEVSVRPWSRRVTTVTGAADVPSAAEARAHLAHVLATGVPPTPTPTPGPVPGPAPGQSARPAVPAVPAVPGQPAAGDLPAVPGLTAVPGVALPGVALPGVTGIAALPALAAVAAAAVAAQAGPELLTAAELSRWFGIPLQEGQSLPMGPATSAWAFRSERPATGGGGPGAPAGPGGTGSAPAGVVIVSAGRGTADTMAMQRARSGTPVPGVGEEAYLVDQGGVCRWGSVVVQVTAPPQLGVRQEGVVAALQAAVVRVAKQRAG